MKYLRILSKAVFFSAMVVLITVVAWAQGPPDIVWMRGGHHSAPSFAFSPDGQFFATGGDDRTLKLWRAADGLLVRTVVGHTDTVGPVTFSPDSTLLASGSNDRTVKLWRVSDGAEIRTWTGHAVQVRFVQFSPDGQMLATADYQSRIRLWDVATGDLLQSWTAHNDILYGLDFSPDGALLASCGNEPAIKIWRVEDGSFVQQMSGHDTYTLTVDFSPDGQTLVSAGGLNAPTVKVWQIKDGALLQSVRTDNFLTGCKYAPSGEFFVSSDYFGLKIWSAADGRLIRRISGGGRAFDISPDSERIVSNNDSNTALWAINLWGVADGALLAEVSGHMAPVRTVRFSPGGGLLASGCDYFESRVKLWDATGGDRIRQWDYSLVSDGVFTVAFSPDEERVIAGGGKGDAKIWRRADGALLQALPHGERGPVQVNGAEYSPDGLLIATGGDDGLIKIWSASSFGLLQRIATTPVRALRFSPDGVLLASGHAGRIELRDASTGFLIRSIPAGSDRNVALSFTPDSQTLVAANWDGSIRIFQIPEGTLLQTLSGHTGKVFSADVSPDGQYVLSGGEDATVRLWSLADGSPVQVYDQETGLSGFGVYAGVLAVAFSGDSTVFGYGRTDGTVVVARNPLAAATEIY